MGPEEIDDLLSRSGSTAVLLDPSTTHRLLDPSKHRRARPAGWSRVRLVPAMAAAVLFDGVLIDGDPVLEFTDGRDGDDDQARCWCW